MIQTRIHCRFTRGMWKFQNCNVRFLSDCSVKNSIFHRRGDD